MKIIADNKIPYLEGVFEPYIDIEYLPGAEVTKNSLKDTVALITRTRTKCDQNLLENTPVKVVASATIGIDHIDTDYCEVNNISWNNAPGCNAGAVQQWFMAAILGYAKDKKIDLRNLTLGVIGVGNVGKKIVEFAESIGMRVLLNDPPREEIEGVCEFRPLNVLMSECDILTFHVPLTEKGTHKTFHMAGKEFFNSIKPGCIIINSCRGEVIETKELVKALHNGTVADAIIDVWEAEPKIPVELLEKAYTASPHIAGYSIEGKANGTAAVVRAVSACIDLPLTDWYPDEIASQEKKRLTIDCNNKSLQEIFHEAVSATYDLAQDDADLRRNIDKFEALRSEYNYRNEPLAWQIKLINAGHAVRESLSSVGFEIIE